MNSFLGWRDPFDFDSGCGREEVGGGMKMR
jgi:hypothetical protein